MTLQRKLRTGAGKRTAFVLIEQAGNATANAVGEVLPEFTPLCRRWAEVAFTSGREFQAAMQIVPMLNGILKLPYDAKTATITSRDRVKISGRIVNISSVFNENEAREKIVLWCVEV